MGEVVRKNKNVGEFEIHEGLFNEIYAHLTCGASCILLLKT